MKLESELKHNGVHEANIKSLRTVRGQMLEAESEAKDKSSRPRTRFWPRGQLGLEDLTSLVIRPTVFTGQKSQPSEPTAKGQSKQRKQQTTYMHKNNS